MELNTRYLWCESCFCSAPSSHSCCLLLTGSATFVLPPTCVHSVPSVCNIPILVASQAPSHPLRIIWSVISSKNAPPSLTKSGEIWSMSPVLPEHHHVSLVFYSIIYWRSFSVLLQQTGPCSLFQVYRDEPDMVTSCANRTRRSRKAMWVMWQSMVRVL